MKTSKELDEREFGFDLDLILDDIVKAEVEYAVNSNGNYVLQPVILIDGFKDVEKHEAFIEMLIENGKKYLSEGTKVLKRMKITFKFDCDDKPRQMPYMRFLFNLIMWKPYFDFDVKLDDSAIFNPEFFHNKKYDDYFNDFADRYRNLFSASEYSEKSLYWVQIYLNKIAVSIGPLLGHSISVYDMVKLAKRNAEINAIIHTEVDNTAQPKEVEEFLAGQTDRFFKLILSEKAKNNPLKPFIRAGVGVQKTQVCESMINFPLKPSLNGETIPIVSNSNLMTNGLNDPLAVYVDAAGKQRLPLLRRNS